MFFEDPEGAIDLVGVVGREFLVQEWDIVGMRWHENYPNPLIVPPDGLALSTHALGSGLTTMAITLPRPDVADSPFIALVVPPRGVMLRVFKRESPAESQDFSVRSTGTTYDGIIEIGIGIAIGIEEIWGLDTRNWMSLSSHRMTE